MALAVIENVLPNKPGDPMQQIRLNLTARKPEIYHIASILDPVFEEHGVTSLLAEHPVDRGLWFYAIYVAADERAHWEGVVRDRLGEDCFGLKIEEEIVPDIDWVSASLKQLKPVAAGRFLVHGSHDRGVISRHPVSIEIDAGQAFGTGHHGTTAGCLDMLEHCLRLRSGQHHKLRRAFDIGTGSGVLAIALAKVAHIPVLATDIDPVAVTVARHNCHLNGASREVECKIANGFSHPNFPRFGKADLVFANILARPLERLAPSMRQHTSPNALIILSGLLPHQRSRIVSAYRQQGMVLKRWLIREGWLTLLMHAK